MAIRRSIMFHILDMIMMHSAIILAPSECYVHVVSDVFDKSV